MSSSSSKSDSASTTSSSQEDNRIVADNGAVALGKDASLLINNELSDNALKLGQGLIDLAKSAGDVVIKQNEAAASQAASNLSTVTSALNKQQLGTSQVFANMIPLLIGGAVLVVIFWILFKKGK